MRLSMRTRDTLNFRDIVVPIDKISILRQLDKVRHNANLNRWELVVPTRDIFNSYLVQYRPKRSI